MSFSNVFVAAGLSLAMQLFAAFFAVSLILFIISSKHKKAGRGTRLSRANNKLKISLIVSAALLLLYVVVFIILNIVSPTSLYWVG